MMTTTGHDDKDHEAAPTATEKNMATFLLSTYIVPFLLRSSSKDLSAASSSRRRPTTAAEKKEKERPISSSSPCVISI